MDVMRRFYSVDAEFWRDQPGKRSRIAWFPALSTAPVPANTFMAAGWEKDLPDGIGEIPSTRSPRGNVPELTTARPASIPDASWTFNETMRPIGSEHEWLHGAEGVDNRFLAQGTVFPHPGLGPLCTNAVTYEVDSVVEPV